MKKLTVLGLPLLTVGLFVATYIYFYEKVSIVETIDETQPATLFSSEIIGYSVSGLPISLFNFGTGERRLLLVGGIHGGYEWNTVALAEEVITFFKTNYSLIPDTVTVSIIPNLNPDGFLKSTGTTSVMAFDPKSVSDAALRSGRVNANGVDLNRNFDCAWSETATWQGTAIGAGSSPFSEPEAQALREYVLSETPAAAIFWHSQAGAVFAATCDETVSTENLALLEIYANATPYDRFPIFESYPVTGDAESWVTTLGIPALTVELETRTDPETDTNLNAVLATIQWLANK
jgi:predicted deacylase